jgi:outer membrane protein TolC
MRTFTLTGIVLVCSALGLRAQVSDATAPLFNTNKTELKLSLDDCVRQALVQNLGIQISRASPEIARYTLGATYGYYDPVFNGRSGLRYDERPGRFDPNVGINVPGDQTRNDSFLAGFSGNLPSGTRYAAELGVTRTTGDRFDAIFSGTNIFIVETNIPTQYSSAIRFGVTQPFLRDFWIDQGRMNIKLARKDVRQSELGYEFNVMLLVRDVALAYYDLIAARDQIRVQQQAVRLAEQFAREQKRRVEVGTAAPLDEKQAESQAATARADLIRAQFNAEAAENTFKRLISGNFVSLDNTRIDPIRASS